LGFVLSDTSKFVPCISGEAILVAQNILSEHARIMCLASPAKLCSVRNHTWENIGNEVVQEVSYEGLKETSIYVMQEAFQNLTVEEVFTESLITSLGRNAELSGKLHTRLQTKPETNIGRQL